MTGKYDLDLVVIIHATDGVLINCLTEHPGRVPVWELVARLGRVVKLLLVEVLDEPDGLGEVLAGLRRGATPELVRQVEVAVRSRRIELLRQLPKELEPVGCAPPAGARSRG